MNNNYLDPMSAPSDDYEVSSKRQKMDIINLPKLDPSTIEPVSEEEWNGLTRELVALRRTLLQTEITAAQFRKIKAQMEEIIRDEERNLKIYLRLSKETKKQLDALGTTICSVYETRDAEATAEAEMSQIKIRMSQRLTDLLKEDPGMDPSSPEDPPTLPIAHNTESDIERELREAEKNIEVELTYMLEQEWASQEFNCDKLEEASIKFHQLHSERALLEEKPTLSSEVAHANELEGGVQSGEYIIPTLREAEDNPVQKEETVSIQERLEVGDKVEQQVMFPPGKHDELSSCIQCYESRKVGTWSAAVANEEPPPPLVGSIPIQENQRADAEEPGSLWVRHDASLYPPVDEDPGAGALDLTLPCPRSNQDHDYHVVDRTCQDLRIPVGSYYVLASHPQYFHINWSLHYEENGINGFTCNSCLALKKNLGRMKDHIWVKHFGGAFKCPFCLDSCALASRDGVGGHIRRYHPNAFPMKKQKRASKPKNTVNRLWKY